MNLSQPIFRARLFRAFGRCLVAGAFVVGLSFFFSYFFSYFFSFSFIAPVHAQSNLIIVQKNTATVRYREGIQFTVKAGLDGSQLNHAELKLKFGKKGREETDTVNFTAGAATFFISEDTNSIATGMPITYSWILTDGKVQLQTNPQTVIYEDTTHTWYQKEGSQVTVRWYNGDNNYGQLMYQLASDALGTYKRRFNMDPREQIYITIYGSSGSYHSTFPDVPEWSGGFSKYGGVEIVAIAPQDHNSSIFIGEGIPHELSHAALYQFLEGDAPRWLDEGFAVYNQNVISIKEYDDMLQQSYNNDSLIPLSSLDKRWPSAEGSALLAYAEGRSIVTFLINSYGNEVWSNVLDQLRRKNADGAFQAVFGVNLAQMEGLWKQSVLGGVKVNMPAALKTGPVASQPTAEDYAVRTGTTTAPTPGRTAGSPESDNGLLLVMLGIALSAILTLVGLSLLIIRNRRREAVLLRFRRAADLDEIEVYPGLSPQLYQTQAPLPPAPAPLSQRALPNAPLPIPRQDGWQPPYKPGNRPAGLPPFAPGNSQPQNPLTSPVQPSNADAFDFISARFDTKAPGAKTYSAGAFLDIDPYGLNFEPVKDESNKEKQV